MLVAYCTLIALGSWEPEVRPHLFDPPHQWATQALKSIGVVPGLAVFSDPKPDPRYPTVKERAHVFHVVARAGAGKNAEVATWSINDPVPTVRLTVPADERMLFQRLLRLQGAHTEVVNQPNSPGVHQFEQQCARSVGRHLQHESRLRGYKANGVVLRWSVEKVDLASSASGSFDLLLLEWSGGKTPVTTWLPKPALVAEKMDLGR